MKKTKIFLVSNTSWSIYNFRSSVVISFIEMGYDVYCVAPIDEYTCELERLGATFIPINMQARGLNPISDIYLLAQLFFLYKKHKPAFIFHYTIKPNIYGALSAGWLKIPSITVICGAGLVFLKKNLLFFLVRWLYTQAAKRPREVWFINQDDKRFFTDEKIVMLERTRVLPGEGIDMKKFTRVKPYTHLPDDCFTFLFSARLLWVKGILYYVNAAKEIKLRFPKTKFVVIGFIENSSKNAVSLTDINDWEKENNIEYRGALKDVKSILEEINCFVFPSFYREGVPRVLLEAGAMEIPVITTDNVGCRDVVIDGVSGLLCETEDTKSLVEKMVKIIEMTPTELEKMGQSGRAIIKEKFDEEIVITYYKKAIGTYL